jgi:hypothetical protein
MKKHIYIIASFVAMSFTACDPMDEVYEEIDSKISDEYKADIKTELTIKDYEYLGKNQAPSYVGSQHYFISEEQAGELIPAVLDKNYPHVGVGTKAAITFNKLLFDYGSTKVKQDTAFSVTERSDYKLGGAKYSNFDKEAQVITFLGAKIPKASEGHLATLTYTWYNGSADPKSTEVTDTYFFVNGQWEDTYHVTNEDYAKVGRNRYNNFVVADEGVLEDHFNKFLTATIVGNKTGDGKYVSYAYFDGSSTKQLVMAMAFNGTRWVQVTEDVVDKSVVRFEKKGSKWFADLSISYNLAAADYAWIAGQANISTDANRANLAKYGNFNTYSWSKEDIIFAMAELLKYKFPNAAVDQKFSVFYDTYPAGLTQLNLIKRENGNFEEPKEDE